MAFVFPVIIVELPSGKHEPLELKDHSNLLGKGTQARSPDSFNYLANIIGRPVNSCHCAWY